MPICTVCSCPAGRPGTLIYLDIKLYYIDILYVKVNFERGAHDKATNRPVGDPHLAGAHEGAPHLDAPRDPEHRSARYVPFGLCDSRGPAAQGPAVRQGAWAPHRTDQRVDDCRHRPAGNASPGDAGRSRHRSSRLGHSSDALGQVTHHQGLWRTPGRHAESHERALESGARDADGSTETARHDCRGTTHIAGRSHSMTATLDVTKTTQAYVIDKMHSEVAFQVRHLLTKVRGRFTEFAGTVVLDQEHPEQSSASLSVDASSIDTGTSDRDTHLRSDDFFGVDTHPTLSFESTRVVKTGDDTYDVVGMLTIRGIAREITVPVTYLGTARDPYGNTRAGFEAGITINRKDFGLAWNAALETGGFLVGDDVQISLSIQALAQQER